MLVFKLEGQPEVASNNSYKTYVEEELAFLNDRETLGDQGIKLMEVSTGVAKVIYSLRELPLNSKFVTYHGNALERISLTEVTLEGHLIEIKMARVRSNTISGSRDNRAPPRAEFLEMLKVAEMEKKKEVLRDRYVVVV